MMPRKCDKAMNRVYEPHATASALDPVDLYVIPVRLLALPCAAGGFHIRSILV